MYVCMCITLAHTHTHGSIEHPSGTVQGVMVVPLFMEWLRILKSELPVKLSARIDDSADF